MFASRLKKISLNHPMKIETSVNGLADILSTIIEGGIIVSRTLSEQIF